LTVCSEITVLGSHVPSLEDIDLSSVDSNAINLVLAIFGDFLIPTELGCIIRGLGMLRSFLGIRGAALSALYNLYFGWGNVGIIFFKSITFSLFYDLILGLIMLL